MSGKLVSKNVAIADRRVEDSTDGKEFVLAHNQTEEDIGEILGLKDNQRVTRPIFGSVSADGGIQLLRFKMKAPSGGLFRSVGIQMKAGEVVKRISFVNGNINIWTRDPDTGEWTIGHDFESAEEPILWSKEDVSFKYYSEDQEIVGVSANPWEGKYWWVYYPTTALFDGFTKLLQMEDVSIPISEQQAPGGGGYYRPNRILMTNNDADPKITLVMPPDPDVSQYGLFKSASFTIANASSVGVAIGWVRQVEPLSDNGEYDDDIGIIGDSYKPNSEFVLDRGVYDLRVRLENNAIGSKVGYFKVYAQPMGGIGQSFPPGLVFPFQPSVNIAGGEAHVLFFAPADGTRFRFECFCPGTIYAQQLTLFMEIERIN